MLQQLNPKIASAVRYIAVRGLYRAAAHAETAIVSTSPMGTAHVNASGKVTIDPSFINDSDTSIVAFVLAHEYYHVVYRHFDRARRAGYDMLLFNVAADLIINTHLERLGFIRPAGKFTGVWRDNPIFDGMPDSCDTSEKVYKWLVDNNKNNAVSEAMGDITHEDGGDGQREFSEVMQSNLKAEAAEEYAATAKAAGEAHDALEIPSPPQHAGGWMPLVKAMAIESGRLVSSEFVRHFTRPSRRPEFAGFISPSYRATVQRPSVYVYIDISGSMGDMPKAIYGGLKGVLRHMALYQPKFFAFNTEIHSIDIKSANLPLGGGTDIAKVIAAIRSDKPDLAIIVSDCEDSISRHDMGNAVIVSNNKKYADYETNDFLTVRKV